MRKKVLFFCAHPEADAGNRYRIRQYLPYLEKAAFQCTVWPFSSARLFQSLGQPGHRISKVVHTLGCAARRLIQIPVAGRFDLVVIHREVFPFFMPLFESLVLHRNPRVLFSFDDAIYTNHEDLSRLPHPLLYRLKYGGSIEKVLRGCVHVIAGNRILAEYASRYNSNVSIFPTVVDCNRYKFRLPDAHLQGPVTIGWMGSRSTAPYLAAVAAALRRVAEANPGRVRFRFFGFPDCKLDLADFASLPFRLETELEDLRSIDVGIMPMPDTEWTRGKCAFKAIQYMAAGIPGVSSPVGITPEVVMHNVNGFLASSLDEWFQALHRLVNEPELRRQIALAGRKTVEESYSVQVWGPRLASLFTDLVGQGQTSAARHTAFVGEA
jgi:glycosyltransferase involved in cell wall biosynthesis